MGYRTGFKTEANAIAREVREELGLGDLDRLDPWDLAKHLDIPVIALSDLKSAAPAAVRHLQSVGESAFSAVTVFRGTSRTIVHNDRHSPGRQVSDITHELCHGLLHHPPTVALDDRGCRHWNDGIEDEAQWLAGALLITEDAALAIVRQKVTLEDAAAHFGVSKQMVIWRLNATGARKRVARARNYKRT